ncbi:hypothetical protein AMJ52_08320, partial [candidate division TA06 bacterium DG_78]
MKRGFLFLFLPLILICRDWTVLVYMAADNGLAQMADLDINEMEIIGSTENMTVLVQIDKPTIGARRLLIYKDTFTELQQLGIIDMCEWQTLRDFLEWGIGSYPAQRYCVILWDHGSGWPLSPNRSFGSDWSSGNELSITNGDLKKAIKSAYNTTGETIHLFAFDACLMQQIEVVYEIKDYIEIFVAPQTVCPLEGFRYDEILNELHVNPDMNEIELSKKIVQINVNNYVDVQPFVMSAVNAKKLNLLRAHLDNLVNSTMDNVPDQTFTALREGVQTIPHSGHPPTPGDEYVDLGAFIEELHSYFSNTATDQLLGAYNNTVIQASYTGEDFSQTSGLAIWFPYTYLEFKQLLDNYTNLDWAQSQWPQFLNWFYNQDDIRPTDISINMSPVQSNNDFHLCWDASLDLASVSYHVIEMNDTAVVFSDMCEDSSFWNFIGFTVASDTVYTGNHSFFSGNASSLDNSIETKNTISVDNLGLLNIYLHYNTEEMADSLIIEYGSVRDVHYGWSDGWYKRRVLLPPGNHRVKISYRTNSSVNRGGCYIDDVSIVTLENGRFIRQYCNDTCLFIFNKLRGAYYYGVSPQDRYGNIGNVSDLI